MTTPVRFTPTRPFRPARGLAGPHAQTLFAYFFRSTRLPPLERECWDTNDGDFVEVDLLRARPDAPHVVVLHGLEGSSRAGYVAEVLRRAHARGWGALALNFRSCGGRPNRLLRAYHAGDTGDLRDILVRLREAIPGPLVGLGFSLGANVLLRHLAEEEERTPFVAVAAISTPFDLAACARSLDSLTGARAIYRVRFLLHLQRKALAKARRFPGQIDVRRAVAARTLHAFDDAVTARVHGFRDAADYYTRASSGPVLDRIVRPALLLSSADDPLVPGSIFPWERVRATPWLTPLVTDRGGHVGFVEGTPVRPRFWAEEQAVAYLAAALGERTAGDSRTLLAS